MTTIGRIFTLLVLGWAGWAAPAHALDEPHQLARDFARLVDQRVSEAQWETRRQRVFATLTERAQEQALEQLRGEAVLFRAGLEDARASSLSIRGGLERLERAMERAEAEFRIVPSPIAQLRVDWKDFADAWEGLSQRRATELKPSLKTKSSPVRRAVTRRGA